MKPINNIFQQKEIYISILFIIKCLNTDLFFEIFGFW